MFIDSAEPFSISLQFRYAYRAGCSIQTRGISAAQRDGSGYWSITATCDVNRYLRFSLAANDLSHGYSPVEGWP